MFMKSRDTSDHVKDATYLVGILLEAIEHVGRNNVVQIITDNTSNNVLTRWRIEDEYPIIFCTPCAMHCMNFLIKD